MKSFGFPRRARLRGRWEFTRAQRAGEKIHVRFFLVFAISTARQRKLEERIARRAEARAKKASGVRVPHAPAPAPVLAGPPISQPARLGVTVTKKVGNSVVRNRIKRWVREAFRLHGANLPCGIDLVFVAKHNAAKCSFAEVSSDVQRLVGRSWTPKRGGGAGANLRTEDEAAREIRPALGMERGAIGVGGREPRGEGGA